MQKKLIILISIIFFGLSWRLSYLVLSKRAEQINLLEAKTTFLVQGETAPRGRILDCHGRIIVTNKRTNVIYYHQTNQTLAQEIKIVKQLAPYVTNLQIVAPTVIKEYWLVTHPQQARDLITPSEEKLWRNRKLDALALKQRRYNRIPVVELNKVNPQEALLYQKMQRGYKFANKPLLEDIDDQTLAQIIELNLPGIAVGYSWKRVYPYDDLLRGILGKVGKIPVAEKAKYLAAGYQINDIVGLSYLEAQYDYYLKGKPALYVVGPHNSLILKQPAQAGNDLVLNIDLDVQMEVERILKEKIQAAKQEINTNYYKESYAIVSNPVNGAIIAMAGKRYLKDAIWQDVTHHIINHSFTVGSVVKGATIAVGYKNKLIDIGTQLKDGCIKLKSVPIKCSHRRLGIVNDVTALMNSSNYYQFRIAIGLTGNSYQYNMKLGATAAHFTEYRSVLKEFGLGTITGIDLPNEKEGLTGSQIADDLLLNLAIGQYDTYTPIQLVQYINTIATQGERLAPQLGNKIIKQNQTLVKSPRMVLSRVNLEPKYLARIKKGFNLVLLKGTGRGHLPPELNPAGKTGTSQSFYGNHPVIETITKTFAGFFPCDNPQFSLVVLSPHVSVRNTRYSYTSSVNRSISKAIANQLPKIS